MSVSKESESKSNPSSKNNEHMTRVDSKQISDRQHKLLQQLEIIEREHADLKRDAQRLCTSSTLSQQISNWENESIKKIRSNAEKARADLEELTKNLKFELDILINKSFSNIQKSKTSRDLTEQNINQLEIQLKNIKQSLNISSKITVTQDDASKIHFKMVKIQDEIHDDRIHKPSTTTIASSKTPSKTNESDNLLENNHDSCSKTQLSARRNIASPEMSYLNLQFGLIQSTDEKLKKLFKYLMNLHPMDKNGPMRGKCEHQTKQMEQFLADTFGFRNIPNKYIVQGVKSFKLEQYPYKMDPDKTIYFPKPCDNSFKMTIREIIQWQCSYKVYTYEHIKDITTEYLRRALQGQSTDGIEAFLMKYVVRVSTCPILMEFDAEIISRELDEQWPNRIKLVSVTGIDFAGRKHDVNDILFYVSNWKDVYEVDDTGKMPALANERDFRQKRHEPHGILYEDRLFKSLKDMAKLRLLACDEQGVQIVVETGIGLGVFAGEHIGIADEVQNTSALAIRTVLEEDGSNYKNIRAIIFALPIIDEDNRRRLNSPFQVFTEQFQTPEYKGSIPILIADQDMHRLTVAIARHGYIVSQLNPADSHGVFGEYWQNRGPAVEEKLALTTLGLLVQHHLINPNVCDPKNYRFFQYPSNN